MDDAAFSLGGALLAGIFGQRPTIINVFSISNYTVESLDSGNTEAVTKMRKNEERRACELMSVDVLFLDFPEIQIRGPLTVHDLNRKSYKPKWDPLYKRIAETLKDLIQDKRNAIALFPLGLGRHVEHRLLSDVGRDFLAADRAHIAFYEDIPYASTMTVSEIGRMARRLKRGLIRSSLPGAEVESKIDLLRVYESQVDDTVLAQVTRYHEAQGTEHRGRLQSSMEAIQLLRNN